MLVGCVAAIAAIGVLMVYSATRGPGAEPYDSTLPEAPGAVRRRRLRRPGAVTASIDYRRVRDFAPLVYLAVVALLVLVVSPLGSERKGTQAWFQLGPFQLQPSELAKLALIVGLAAVIAQFRERARPAPPRRRASLVAARAARADHAAARPRHRPRARGHHRRHPARRRRPAEAPRSPSLVVGVLGVAVVLNTDMLADYQRDRLTTFLDQDGGDELAGRGVQPRAVEDRHRRRRRRSARASSKGTQTRLDNVPEQHTDFIFTAVGEELGFVGAGTLLALFAIVVWRIWRTAQLARDDFGTLSASACCACCCSRSSRTSA